jgi:drug/metabolite transporter (DMT)-like permease
MLLWGTLKTNISNMNRSDRKIKTEKLPRLGFFLLAILSIFWGTSWPIMKIAVGEILPWTFRSLCIFFGGLGVLILAKVTGSKLTIPRAELRPLLLVALLNSTCWHLGSAYGLIYMKAGRAAIIAFTMPVWASILAIFILGERLTWARLLGLCFGVAGLLILITPDIRTIGSAPLGAVFMLGAAVSWALGTVFLKYFHWTMPTAVLAGWQTFLGGIPVIIGALMFEPTAALLQVSWRAILAVSYIIILPMTLCNWAYVRLVQIFPASLAAIGTLAIPVIGVFSSAFVLGESVGTQEIAALILVLMALATSMVNPVGKKR